MSDTPSHVNQTTSNDTNLIDILFNDLNNDTTPASASSSASPPHRVDENSTANANNIHANNNDGDDEEDDTDIMRAFQQQQHPQNQTETQQRQRQQHLQSRVDTIEHDAARLISILQQVSESLSTRTSAAASMAAGHVIVSEELSSLAKGSTEQLQATWHKFLSQISQLRQYFDVISTLADKTAQVRQQVIRLEQQVMRI